MRRLLSPTLPSLKRKSYKKREETRRVFADWYGEAQGDLEAGRNDRVCEAGKEMEKLLDKALPRDLSRQFTLAEHWHEIAGEQLERLLSFSAYESGVITLEVRHSALLAAPLDEEKRLILAEANRVLGAGCCKEIKLVPYGRGK